METKILPTLPTLRTIAERSKLSPEAPPNHTVDPQTFVTTLAGTIAKAKMEKRCTIQSFDFRTLRLVEEQFPTIPTAYLTQDAGTLSTDSTPPELRGTPR